MSIEDKFTPGPWFVTYTHTFEGYQGLGIIGTVVNITLGKHNFPLGVSGIQCSEEVERDYKTAIANAALIVAAPDMYGWQGDALAMLRHIYCTVAMPIETVHEMYQLIERGEAIQKKARGESASTPSIPSIPSEKEGEA